MPAVSSYYEAASARISVLRDILAVLLLDSPGLERESAALLVHSVGYIMRPIQFCRAVHLWRELGIHTRKSKKHLQTTLGLFVMPVVSKWTTKKGLWSLRPQPGGLLRSFCIRTSYRREALVQNSADVCFPDFSLAAVPHCRKGAAFLEEDLGEPSSIHKGPLLYPGLWVLQVLEGDSREGFENSVHAEKTPPPWEETQLDSDAGKLGLRPLGRRVTREVSCR